MKSTFQWIKLQDNQRFQQADKAKSSSGVLPEILDSTQRWNQMGIIPLFELQLRRLTTRWKDNFINFPIELYFGICYALDTG
jgi:hypothetical protein